MMGVYKETKRVTGSHPNVFIDLCTLEVLITKVAEGSKAIIKSRTVKYQPWFLLIYEVKKWHATLSKSFVVSTYWRMTPRFHLHCKKSFSLNFRVKILITVFGNSL